MGSRFSRLLLLWTIASLAFLGGCSRPGEDNAQFMGGRAAGFVDEAGALSLADVRQNSGWLFANGEKAGEIASEEPGLSAFWLTFPAPDPDTLLAAGWNRPFAMTLKEPAIRHLDVYLVRGDDVVQRGWDWLDGRRVDGNGYRYPLIGFEPSQLSGAVFFLRIVSNAPVQRLVWLSDFQSFFGNYNAETTTLSITIGILFAILVYILALGSTLRSGANLWLAACISAELIHIVCFSAVFETQVVPGAVHLSLALVLASRFAIQATLVAFTAKFLRIGEHRPALKRLSQAGSTGLACLAVVALVDRSVLLPILQFPTAGTIVFISILCAAAALRSAWRTAAFALCWLPALLPVAMQNLFRAEASFSGNLAFTDATLFGLCASFVLFAIFATVDIRQREKALRREILDNVERFRGFAEIGTDGFWEIDGAGRLTFLSGRQIGPTRLSLGETLVDRLAESSSSEYLRPIRETIAGRLPFDDRRIRLEQKDRDTWISLSGRAIGDTGAGGEGTAVYRGLLRDVTQETERESRRAVEQRMLALGQLVGSVAHEVNNLIHPIVNLTKRLRNRQAAVADRESMRLMDLIDLSSRQAAKVVSELLHSTRDQRWKDIDRPLSLAIEYSVEAVRPALPASVKIDVVTEDIAQPAVKIGDILQIVGNLLSNAVHAMNGEGHIAVSLGALAEGARLTVSDDGAGMEEGVRQRALQPFFTTKSDGRGTGVGLYVVQKIVRDYGGWIAIDSTPGFGTTFTILFPFRKDEDGDFGKDSNGPRRG